MRDNRWLAILNVVALLFTLALNSLANILPINGLNTGEVSDRYPSLFTPAGITFSIWSVLYVMLIGFTVYQLYWYFVKPGFKKLAILFTASCILNGCWILAWHYLFPVLSLLIMLMLLGTLIGIFTHLNKFKVETLAERIWVRLPFTLYFAWICVATIANTSAVLVSIPGVDFFFSEVVWTMAMMVVAAVLGLLITLRYKAPAFSLVIIWALFGIFLRWQQTDQSVIATLAVVLIVVLSSVYIYASQRFLKEQNADGLFQ
jgi:hypothetical protein